MKKHIVIDGYGLIYRSYFAFIRNPLVDSKGRNISSIYGFSRMLMKIAESLQPDTLTVALDAPQKTFRHELYSEYKANRERMPEDLIDQIPDIRSLIELFGATVLEYPGYEADDILGTLAKQWQGPEDQVYIISGDKDIYQLLSFGIKIYSPQKGIQDLFEYNEENVREKLGVKINQICDYMALVGDSSDNIPGVKGIGPKGAVELLKDYPTLEDIYENVDQISKKSLKQKLIDDKENAFLSRKLVTIENDLQIEEKPKDWSLEKLYRQELVDFFSNREMPSIASDLAKQNPKLQLNASADNSQVSANKEIKRTYHTVSSLSEFEKLATRLKKHQGFLSLDTETTSPHPNEARLLGISLSLQDGEAWYIHLQRDALFDPGLEWESIRQDFEKIISRRAIQIVGQNYKYDYIVLKRHGIEPPNPFLDTMIASYLLAPGERRHNLDNLALLYLNETMISYDDLVGSGRKKIELKEVPLEPLAEYAAEDADMTLRLARIFFEKLQEEKLWQLYTKIENPLLMILAHMEMEGVAIDRNYFKKLSQSMHQELQKLEAEIHEHAGKPFNVNSTLELQQILFEDLKLNPVKKTKTGYSTDISVLEALIGEHPIIESLIHYRMYAKLLNTYVDSLPQLINEDSGRIHSSFNQTVAATGRLSSSDPNLQNIPIKDQAGRDIRKGFIARKGWELLSADYSQIELRILAHFSEDPFLLEAFTNALDIHRLTASQIFQIATENVDSDQRRIGKTVNFSVIYGQTPFGLSKQLGISQSEAKLYIEEYFKRYTKVKEYKEEVLAFGREHGWVETLLGRKRHIDGLNDKNRFRREGAERMAFNTPIQGTASDLIKLSMINLDEKMKQQNFSSRMIIQVHDELLFEVHPDEKEQMRELVKNEMESVYKLKVPLDVEVNFGGNWDEAH